MKSYLFPTNTLRPDSKQFENQKDDCVKFYSPLLRKLGNIRSLSKGLKNKLMDQSIKNWTPPSLMDESINLF